MRVLLIGGTGYIGRAVASALADQGHAPVVLARSAESRAKVEDERVEVLVGSLDDVESVVGTARSADATVYLAIPGLTGARDIDVVAIDSIVDAYAGTGKAFVLTSGLAVYLGSAAAVITPETSTAAGGEQQRWRVDLENRVLGASDRGLRGLVVRPSIVYGNGSASSLVLALLDHVASGGTPFYIGEGANRIPTVHVRDLADVVVAALTRAPAGSAYNVASNAVLGLDLAIAAAIAAGVDRPAESVGMDGAVRAIGGAGAALAMDIAISTAALHHEVGWNPVAPDLIAELVSGSIRPRSALGHAAPSAV